MARRAVRRLAAALGVLATLSVAAAEAPAAAAPAVPAAAGSGAPLTQPTCPHLSSAERGLARSLLTSAGGGLRVVGTCAGGGPASPQALASYASDPETATTTLERLSSGRGYATWVRTWADPSGLNTVRELAVRVATDPAAHRLRMLLFDDTFQSSGEAVPSVAVAGVPGGLAYRVQVPATVGAGGIVPAQTVQVATFEVGHDVIAFEIDSTRSAANVDAPPIGAAADLARRQYAVLAPPPPAPATTPNHALGYALVSLAGLILLVMAVSALLRRRRRKLRRQRRHVHPSHRPPRHLAPNRI